MEAPKRDRPSRASRAAPSGARGAGPLAGVGLTDRIAVALVGETPDGEPVLIAAGEQATVAVQPTADGDWIYLEVADLVTGAVVAYAAATRDVVELISAAGHRRLGTMGTSTHIAS